MSISMVYDGSIFDSKMSKIACPVNCVGIMGNGLAKEFKERYTRNFFDIYKYWCRSGVLRLGRPCIYMCSKIELDFGLKDVVLFPTKHHYTDKTDPQWISDGMRDLFNPAEQRSFENGLAIPALGRGLGGLDFEVLVDIVRKSVPDSVDVEVYHPMIAGDSKESRLQSWQSFTVRGRQLV